MQMYQYRFADTKEAVFFKLLLQLIKLQLGLVNILRRVDKAFSVNGFYINYFGNIQKMNFVVFSCGKLMIRHSKHSDDLFNLR